jgi:transcriptional regulator with XRE-family HTH domain
MGRQGRQPPSPIDIHVGSRMRMRRMMLGWSQEKLADAFGLTFQQVIANLCARRRRFTFAPPIAVQM